MKSLNLIIISVMAICLTSCSSTSFLGNYSNILINNDGVSRPSEFPVLRATGYASISRQSGATKELKQIKAMRASKLEAYRELAEQVNGIYLQSNSSVNSNTVEQNSSLKATIDGYVHGARVLRQYPIGDTYATELELDTKIIYDLYDIRGAL